ncbi:MAG TPA: response regulator [Phycisphaerae bacterium]|jgi:two-component system alkaline phosphatase synthesis response regulator PhoP|nr:response regulator [Phycisphaerae bacterium]HOL26623.1 response regulator [Phycisphaerae bacterium]HPP20357.1 response regulator [Phycisphaerae bacterium]HPU32758.1 response regulator [Phycisphaerae bacterium]HQA45241.1 response regulator [Phycisphaerae bacterium]
MTSKTVLIADDETHILNVLAMKLNNGGFNVLQAEDGAEAFRLARSELPDLIITDYQMPRMSGLELSSRLNSDPATSAIPVVLLTARGFSIAETQTISPNIRCIMSKPFSPREILARTQALLVGDIESVGATA